MSVNAWNNEIITTFNSLSDTFNPIKNPITPRNISWKDYFNILKTMYTEDFVINYDLRLFTPGYNNNSDYELEIKRIKIGLKTLLEKTEMPPWFIAFCYLSVNSSDLITIQLPKISFKQSSNSSSNKRPFRSDYEIFSYQNFDGTFESEKKIIKESIKKLEQMQESLELCWSFNSRPNMVSYIDLYLSYLQRSLTYTSQNTSFNILSVIELLKTEGYRIKVQFPSNTNITIGPQIVPRKGDKTRLYETFPASTKIPSLINKKYKYTEEEKPTLYGVELEVSTEYKSKDLINSIQEEFIFCKRDGTISGSKNNFLEIVTVPASLRVHKKMWSTFFSNLDHKHFDQTKATNNGMHVHIERLAFNDPNHIARFCWFIANPSIKNFLIYVSERNDLPTNGFCKQPLYNAGLEIKKSLIKSDDHLFKQVYKLFLEQGHYAACNVSNPNTIELRIFKSLPSFSTVIKNLEVTDCILEFTRLNKTKEKLSLEHFLQYAKTSKYRFLQLLISKIDNLSELLIESKMNESIFGLTEMTSILNKLNQISLEENQMISEDYTSQLNRLFNMQAFQLKEGKLTIHRGNEARMFELEHQLLKEYSDTTDISETHMIPEEEEI